MIARLRLALSGIAYASSAVAGFVTLAVAGRPGLGWLAAGWFAIAWGWVWAASAGTPRIGLFARRGVDIAAIAVAVAFGSRALSMAALDGGGWGDIAPLALVALQALRALVITTPAEAESFLATGLALAYWTATRTGWEAGAMFLALFMWLWMTAMALVQWLEDAQRRGESGGTVAETAGLWPMVRSGATLSFLAIALGLGVFFVVIRPGNSGAGGDSSMTRDAIAGAWRQLDALAFDGQSGPRPAETPVYRIRAPRAVSRFRAQSFDRYDAAGWRRTEPEGSALPEGSPVRLPLVNVPGLPAVVPGERIETEIEMIEGGADALLVAGWPVELVGEFPGSVVPAADGGLRSAYPVAAGFRYRAISWMPAWAVAGLDGAVAGSAGGALHRYVQLPPHPGPSLVNAVAAWSGQAASPWGRVTSIAAGLRASRAYRFELAMPTGGRDPVEWFLAEAREGNCLNFASSMTLLARMTGVPARLTVGYLAHRYDDAKGEWTVSTADGHAWTEVLLEGIGWVPLDATPAAEWSGRTVGGGEAVAPAPESAAPPNLSSPIVTGLQGAGGSFRNAVRHGGPWILAGWALLWLGWSGWRLFRSAGGGTRRWRQRATADAVQREFLRTCDAAARTGHARKEFQTSLEFARAVRGWAPAASEAMRRLSELATAAEFGPVDLGAEARREAKTLSRSAIAVFAKAAVS